jgi:hypothetical protein
VLACLAAGAAAAYFALARHHENYARQTRPSVLPTTVDNPNPQPPASGGSMITGEIRLEGNAPPPRLIDFGPAGNCAERGNQPLYDDSLLVNLDDTLQNVVVSVIAGLPQGMKYSQPGSPVYLDEDACSFQPHVLAMRTGQPIVLRDSDPIPHKTHSLSVRNPSFNITEPSAAAGRFLPGASEPEIFQVKCDIHPWMQCWFCVFNHPYFQVSQANGTFTLNGLPPGRYHLRAWHERLGTIERDVVVKSGQDETINFVFSLPHTPNSPQAVAPTQPGYLAPHPVVSAGTPG